MAKLTVNDIGINQNSDASIRLVRGNVMVGGQDSYTQPEAFSMEDPQNAKALKYLHKLRTVGDRHQTHTAKYEVQGLTVIDGTATIIELTDTTCELTTKGNTQSFWTPLEDIQMSDLDWPEISAFNAATRTKNGVIAELMSTLTSEKDYLCFELINDPDVRPSDADVTASAPDGMFNYWDMAAQSFVNSSGDGAGGYKYNNNVFIRLHKAIDFVFNALGYSVEYNYFANDKHKNIVLINVFNLWSSTGACTCGDFLPSGTVYTFLNSLREAGVVFNISTAAKKVSIQSTEENFSSSPVVISDIIKSSPKITVDDAVPGYRVSMQQRGGWNEGEHSVERDNRSLSYLGTVATYSDLPSPTDFIAGGNPTQVRSEGVFYEIADGTNGGVWKRLSGFTKERGSTSTDEEGEEIDIEVPISVALPITVKSRHDYTTIVKSLYDGSETEVNHACTYYRQRTIVSINTEDDDTIDEAIILTNYIGMLDAQVVRSNPNVSPQYPHVCYMGTSPTGVQNRVDVNLETSFYRDLLMPRIDLLRNCYTVEIQHIGTLSDMLITTFPPLLIEHQKAIVKQRSAKITEDNSLLTITDTVLIEQVL